MYVIYRISYFENTIFFENIILTAILYCGKRRFGPGNASGVQRNLILTAIQMLL